MSREGDNSLSRHNLDRNLRKGHRQVMRKLLKSSFLDKVHLWSVRSLMGFTVVGSVVVGVQFYDYISNVRPAKLEIWRKAKEDEVALEQQEKELELLRRQREAEDRMTS